MTKPKKMHSPESLRRALNWRRANIKCCQTCRQFGRLTALDNARCVCTHGFPTTEAHICDKYRAA
jgi:hypothetical protein